MKTSLFVALFVLVPAAPFAQTVTSMAPAKSAIARIDVTPPSIKTGELTPFSLAATAYDANGRVVPTTFTFTAGDASIVNVTPQGYGNTWSLGRTVIIVSSPDAPTVVTKVPVEVVTAVAIEIMPSAATIALGSQAQYELIGVWADGRREQISGAIVSGNPAIASIDNMRVLHGNATGSTSLAARIDGPKRSWSYETGVTVGVTSVTIEETAPKPTLQQIDITPGNLTATVGSKVGYSAVGSYSDGSRKILAASWSATPTIAAIDQMASLLAQSTGDAKIVATVSTPNGPVAATTALHVRVATR